MRIFDSSPSSWSEPLEKGKKKPGKETLVNLLGFAL